KVGIEPRPEDERAAAIPVVVIVIGAVAVPVVVEVVPVLVAQVVADIGRAARATVDAAGCRRASVGPRGRTAPIDRGGVVLELVVPPLLPASRDFAITLLR